ncbi:MAG: glycosyl hydrolase, partial [Winogradskyella sp.]
NGTNHPNGVMTYFNLKDLKEDDKVSLTYFDIKGDTIKTFSTSSDKKNKLKVKKGANQFVWDMTYDGAEKLDGMILWWASLDGPKAIPGTYKVSLNIKNAITSSTSTSLSTGYFEMSQPFTILADPRAESTQADMQKQFDFIEDVNKTMDDAHQSIKKIRAVNKQLGAFQKQYKDDETVKELVEKAKALEEQLSTIEKELYQTQNRSGQDPLNFPIRLTNKLGHLNALVRMGDFAPTEQDIAVKNELSAKIETQLKAFNTILNDEVKAFNAAFNAKQLNYLFVED